MILSIRQGERPSKSGVQQQCIHAHAACHVAIYPSHAHVEANNERFHARGSRPHSSAAHALSSASLTAAVSRAYARPNDTRAHGAR